MADALFPPGCMVCHAPVADAQKLCAPCWGEAHLISGTVCDGCSAPMDLSLRAGETIRCDDCAAGALQWDRGRAAALYGGSARALVLSLKHGDRPDIALALGRWMSRAAADLIEEADVMVPIPLHWRRFLTRRYNQSAELSRVMSRETGLPHAPDILRRMRPTEMQKHSAAARTRNVEGVFAVPPYMREAVRGRRILIVDDVMTTGATLNAATTPLREAGAAQVSVAVFARVQPTTEF
jgi:ComF family protein